MRAARWAWAVAVAVTVGACASAKPADKPAYPAAGAPPRGGQEALAAIRAIEVDPFREEEEFRKEVAEVMTWVLQARDLTVLICADLLPPRSERGPYDHVLTGQMVFGQAAFLIEHPTTSPADQAVYTAGLVAAIRAYRKLVVLHPGEKRTDWDQLDAAERNNQLPLYVQKATGACPRR